MNITREFYINKDLVNKEHMLDAIVYHGDKNQVYYAQGFSGKRAKPDFSYRFKTEQEMRSYIVKYFDMIKRKHQSKDERKVKIKDDAQKFLASLKPGTILYDTWGYDQTNVEFYKVLEVKGSKVRIVELGHKTIEGSEGFMSCNVLPSETEHGNAEWKTVRSNRIKINESVSLSLWDGKPIYKSWYA